MTNDNEDGSGPLTYIMYSGNESAIGEYLANIWVGYAETDTAWTLKGRVNGEVEGVEEGMYSAKVVDGAYVDTFVISDANTSLTDLFFVTVDSIADAEC